VIFLLTVAVCGGNQATERDHVRSGLVNCAEFTVVESRALPLMLWVASLVESLISRYGRRQAADCHDSQQHVWRQGRGPS
jgi:hypothetical protein